MWTTTVGWWKSLTRLCETAYMYIFQEFLIKRLSLCTRWTLTVFAKCQNGQFCKNLKEIHEMWKVVKMPVFPYWVNILRLIFQAPSSCVYRYAYSLSFSPANPFVFSPNENRKINPFHVCRLTPYNLRGRCQTDPSPRDLIKSHVEWYN